MKNKSLIFVIVGIILLGGIVFAITRNTPTPQTSTTAPAQTSTTYSLKSDSQSKTYSVNAPNEYSFSIVDQNGNTLKNFAITHTKLMHVIVVRKDLAYFQHVHPDFDQSTGVFTLKDLTFPADGEYRIFADFAAGTAQKDSMGMPQTTTLNEDVPAGNLANYKQQPIGTQETSKTFDGMQVSLMQHNMGSESMLVYSLSQNGKPVTDLEPYLGALGHAVILRESNLDFIHAHPSEDASAPQNGTVEFMVDFPEAGTYKVFTQFQRGGKVITTDFVITAQATASSGSMQGMNMQSVPSMSH